MHNNDASTEKHIWYCYDFTDQKWYQLNLFEATQEECTEQLEKTEYGRSILDQMEYPHQYSKPCLIFREETAKKMCGSWSSSGDSNLHTGIEY